ncbi:MAG: HD domain-containing protein [Desulfobulbus sp.]
MKVIEHCESLMRKRPAGWWEELCALIPELAGLAGTPQPREYHAEGDVAQHTRLALSHCPHDCSAVLLWVALLHDIGKPKTTVIQTDGHITAHGHAKRGAEQAESILIRLGMPTECREQITWTIRHHVFQHSWQLHSPADLSNRQRNFIQHPWFPLLLEFLHVDTQASVSKQRETDHYLFYKNLLATIQGHR